MSRLVMQQALEGLIAAEVLLPLHYKSKWIGIKAIVALESILAQPEQEPVPVGITSKEHEGNCALFDDVTLLDETFLYTAPPRKPWLNLSDTEINKIVDLNTSDDGGFDIFCDGFAVAHIVCAKLKELNK